MTARMRPRRPAVPGDWISLVTAPSSGGYRQLVKSKGKLLTIAKVAYAADVTGMIVKKVHALADGRELIYFDDADTALPPDRAPDLRELDPRPPTAEMRQDPLTGEWISIAAARQNRVVMPSVMVLAAIGTSLYALADRAWIAIAVPPAPSIALTTAAAPFASLA